MSAVTVKLNAVKSLVLMLFCMLPLLGIEQQRANADNPVRVTFARSADRGTIVIEMYTDGKRPLPVWQNFVQGNGAAVVTSNTNAQPLANGQLFYQTVWAVNPNFRYLCSITRNGAVHYHRHL